MDKLNNETKKGSLIYLHLFIICLFMFGFGFLPVLEPISPVGMKLIGVFIGLLYGWSVCGMFWPSLLGLIALGFSGLFPSVSSTVAATFGSSDTIVFMLLIFVFIELLNECGLITILTNRILTFKLIDGKVWRLVTAILAVSFVLSAFGQAFAAMFLVWEIWYNIFKQVGYKPGDKFPTLMIIATILVMCAGGILLPIINVPFIMLSAYADITHETVNFFKYMVFIIPIALLMFFEVILAIRYIFKPDISLLETVDVNQLVDNTQLSMNNRQKWILAIFLGVIIALVLPGVLPATWWATLLLKSLGNSGVCIVAILFMVLMKVDGKPLLDFSQTAKKAINWDVLFFLGTILLIASAVSNPATGISDFLKIIINPLLSIQSPYLFMVLFTAIAFTLTNFLNNMIVGVLFLPVIVIAGQTMGISSWALVVLIIVAVNFSILTPAAAPVTGILFANKEWIKYGRDIKYIFVIFVLWGITLVTVGVALANLIF